MNSEGRFGCVEGISLTAIIITSKIFFSNIGILVRKVGTTAWLSSTVSCLTTLVFFFFLYNLMKRFPGSDLFEVFQKVLGKVLTTIIGSLFVLYIIFYAGTNVREFVEMIRVYSLPTTPTSVLVACVIITSAILCSYGLEALARVATLFFIPIMVGLVLIFLLAWNLYDPKLLRPYAGFGLMNTIQCGFFRSSGYTEILILPLVMKSLPDLKCFKKCGILSILISGAVFIICTGLYVMAFGYASGGENMAGVFELSRAIYFNRFFQRVETLFLFMWVISSVITVAAAHYISLSTLSKVFSIKNYKPLVLPASYLIFMVAMLPASLMEVVEVNINITRHISMLWLFSIPLLVLLISVILNIRGEQRCGDEKTN